MSKIFFTISTGHVVAFNTN